MNALELLSGDAQTFRTKIWASRTHLHHADPAALSDLLSYDDVDELVTSSGIRTPAVRLAKDGAVLDPKRYTRHASLAGERITGLVDPGRLLDLFADGATVVLQGLHRYHTPLARLVDSLELELGHPCQANAYLTPPGGQGFAVHRDSHDVICFQTYGSKLWEVGTDNSQDTAMNEVRMEPGVCMYLPTGTPHAARALDEVSLHVTVGINQLTWRTLLDRALREALDEEAVGEHLPAGYLDDPAALDDSLAERLRSLAARVERADTERLVREHTTGFLSHRLPRLRGGLRDRMTDVVASTVLRRRPGRPFSAQLRGEDLDIALGDRTLTVPARVRRSVAWVADQQGTFTPGDVPGLDESSRLVLCRRLLREGALEVVS